MQSLPSVFRQKLALLRESIARYRKERSRTRRWRQRVLQWEASNRRSDTRRCAFCEAARGWILGTLQAAFHLPLAIGRRMLTAAADTALRWRRLLQHESGDHTDRTSSSRVFRRRGYSGSRTRRFELHLPPSYRGDTAIPLIMVLHGCRQNHSDIRTISTFDAIADREGFIVVYPFVTGYSGIRIRNCWGWWLESEIRPGAGEVEDLWQIIEQVKQEVRVDERRIHIAGLSSGGGMAVAAMVVHGAKIASGSAVAGVPYSETPRAVSYGAPAGAQLKPTDEIVGAMQRVMGEGGRPSPILVVHSVDDPVVNIDAARSIRDSWGRCYGLDTSQAALESSGITDGVSWCHARYREARRRSVIETFFIEGRGHGWYGGNPGKHSYPAAPDVSELMWRFFKRHPLHAESRIRRPIRKAS